MAEKTAEQIFEEMGITPDKTVPSPVVRTVSDAEVFRTIKDTQSDTKSFSTLFSTAVAENEAPVFKAVGLDLTPDSEGETKLTDDDVKLLTEGFTEKSAIKKILEEASEHGVQRGFFLKQTFERQRQQKEDLANAGLKGLSAEILAEIASPSANAAMAATAGAGAVVLGPVGATVAGTATKAGQITNRLRKSQNLARLVGGGAAAEVAAIEYLRMQNRYDMTGGDVATAALLTGFGVGGVVSLGQTARRRVLMKKFLDDTQEMSNTEIDELSKIMDEQAEAQQSAFAVQNNHFKAEGEASALDSPIMGSAQFDTRRYDDLTDAEKEDVGIQRGGFSQFRGIISAVAKTLGDQAPPRVRHLASKLAMNSTGLTTAGGKTSASLPAATEIRGQLQAVYRARAAEALQGVAKSYTKRTGLQEVDLFEEAYDVMLFGKTGSKEAELVASTLRPLFDEVGGLAVKADVEGFTPEVIGEIKNYLPRIANRQKIRELEELVGADNEAWAELGEAFIRQGQPNIRRDVAKMLGVKVSDKKVEAFIKKLSRNYMKNFRANNNPYSQRLANNDIDLENLEAMLRAENFSDDEIDIVVELFSQGARPTKGHKRSRHRMRGDESATVDFVAKNGEVLTIKFTDLVEKNVANLFDQYLFQMGGSIALARHGIDTNKVGSGFETMMGKIVTEGAPEDQVRALQYMYEMVKGTHIYRSDMSPTTIRWLNRTREVNFVISMGMSGMSALMELPLVVLPNSLEVLRKAVPRYNQLFRDLKSGQVRDKVGRELMAFTGVGSDGIIGEFTQKVTRMEGDLLETTKQAGDYTKLDEKLGKGRVLMSFMSGLSGVTDMLRRMSLLNQAISWETAARKGELPYSRVKLEQTGLSVAESKEITKLIKKYATYIDKDKQVLDALNVEKWPNKALADKYILSVRRLALQQVQEMDAGSVRSFFRSPVGMTAFQFLSFPLATLEQQAFRLGTQFAAGDHLEVAKAITGAAFMGSLMYSARVYMNSIGRSDQDEYIERNLQSDRLIKGTISQIGPASLFSYIYEITTGVSDGSTKALTPASLSTLTAGAKGMRDVLGILGGEEMTEAEVRSALRVLPFSSLYGARQLLNSTANALTD